MPGRPCPPRRVDWREESDLSDAVRAHAELRKVFAERLRTARRQYDDARRSVADACTGGSDASAEQLSAMDDALRVKQRLLREIRAAWVEKRLFAEP